MPSLGAQSFADRHHFDKVIVVAGRPLKRGNAKGWLCCGMLNKPLPDFLTLPEAFASEQSPFTSTEHLSALCDKRGLDGIYAAGFIARASFYGYRGKRHYAQGNSLWHATNG